MTEQDNIKHTHCWLCLQEFKNKINVDEDIRNNSIMITDDVEEIKKYDNAKVRDHDHLKEFNNYRGAACFDCNIKTNFKNYKLKVLFHNLKGYDSHNMQVN